MTRLFDLNDYRIGPMHAPCELCDPDADRDEAIAEVEADIWLDADWLEGACNYDRVELSPELCRQMVLINAHLGNSPASEDGDYRRALRELIACMDRAVRAAAERHVDDGGDFDGEAA